MDTAPIVNLFNTLITAGMGLGAIVCASFLVIAGFQWMTAGGSARAIEGAKASLTNALIGFAIVVLSKVLANLVASALGAPSAA